MGHFVKHLILILFLLSCFITGNAQSDEPIQEDKNKRYIAIGVTPLNLFEPITPTLEGTVDFKISKRVIIEGKFGLQSFKMYNTNRGDNVERLDDKYHELKLGIKLNTIAGSERESNLYFGFEYLRLNHSFRRTYGHVYTTEGSWKTFSNSDISRKINSFRVTLSMRAPIKEKFKWEIYMGFGVKEVNITHSSISDNGSDYDLIFHPIATREGKTLKPDFVIGVKFMYELFSW